MTASPVDAALAKYPTGATGVRCPSLDLSVKRAVARGCRCMTCTTAMRADRARYRDARAASALRRREAIDALPPLCPETGMGPAVAFRDGCRCSVCTATKWPSAPHAASLAQLEARWELAAAAFRAEDAYLLDMCDEIARINGVL